MELVHQQPGESVAPYLCATDSRWASPSPSGPGRGRPQSKGASFLPCWCSLCGERDASWVFAEWLVFSWFSPLLLSLPALHATATDADFCIALSGQAT